MKMGSIIQHLMFLLPFGWFQIWIMILWITGNNVKLHVSVTSVKILTGKLHVTRIGIVGHPRPLPERNLITKI